MKTTLPTIGSLTMLAAATLLAFPAAAQTNAELAQRIEALQQRVNEQAQELSRVGTKTESLEDTRDANGIKQLKISGYMDPTFISNRAQNRAGFQFLNGVGDNGYSYDNSSFGVVSLDFQKETDSGAKYRLTIVPYRGTESVGRFQNRIVNEASLAVPLGDPTTFLIAGHIPDWSGYEYIPANQNKLITHNLLVDLTLPATYTGAGLQTVSGKWTVKGMLANVNSSIKNAGAKTPALVYRGDYAATEYFGFGFAGLHGKVANPTQNVTHTELVLDQVSSTAALPVFINSNVVDAQGDSRADLFEVDTFFIRGDLTLNGQLSFGRQQKASITPDPISTDLRTAQWWGLSALAAYKVNPRWEVVARADFINNRKNGGGLFTYATPDGINGIGPSQSGGDAEVGANRSALSFGTSYVLDPSTTIKAEYRLDRASQAVFVNVKDGSFGKTNSLVGAAVVVSF
ncbi:MAG: DUF3138 family protein [Leptothrix sp. (in: b-proteobacteria)]